MMKVFDILLLIIHIKKEAAWSEEKGILILPFDFIYLFSF